MCCSASSGKEREEKQYSFSCEETVLLSKFAEGYTDSVVTMAMYGTQFIVMPVWGGADRPNHILGIADPASIETGARHGADTFDSCFPTRVGRHGTLLTRDGNLHIASRCPTAKAHPVKVTGACIHC